MIAVLFFGATFVAGVIAIGFLQSLYDGFGRHLDLPKDVVQALLIGAGYLVTLPFVLSILAENHVSILASLIVGGLLLLGTGVTFTYAMFRLILPAVRVPLSKRR